MLAEILKGAYIAGCLIAIFSSGLLYKFEHNKSMPYLMFANLCLMAFPFSGILIISFGPLPDIIMEFISSSILLFCGLSYLFYSDPSNVTPRKSILHCLPFLLFFSTKIIFSYMSQHLLFMIVYFGILFSYMTAIWQKFNTQKIKGLKGSKALIVSVTLIVILNGSSAVAYLLSSDLLSLFWCALNTYVSIYFLTLSYLVTYSGKEKIENGIEINKPIKSEKLSVQSDKEYLLTTSVVTQSIKSLNHLLENEQVYLEHTLSLSFLAEKLGLSNHQASELLNQHMNSSLYALINGYRIEHACKLLSEPKVSSVTDIAQACGFNNKNTFYTEFKKRKHMTPNQWRKKENKLSEF